MITIVSIFIALIGIIIGKLLFKRLFNHITIYAIIWFGLIFFYELKLFAYYELSNETLTYIFIAYLSLILGTVLYFAAKNAFGDSLEISNGISSDSDKYLYINNYRNLKILILSTSLISLIGALLNWQMLFNEFGNVEDIVFSANQIYSQRVAGELDYVPYITVFSYVGLFFSAVYCVKINKLSVYSIFPFISIIIQDLAMFGRLGMLFSFLLFLTIILLMTYKEYILNKNIKNPFKLIKSLVFIFIFFFLFAVLIKSARKPFEEFSSSSTTLRSYESGILFSPSVYMYMSGHIGVFNVFLKEQQNDKMFGENTFLPVYRILYKLNITREPIFYSEGYYIPMWMNTGTYLKDLLEDYGILGILAFPLLLGFFITLLWFKYYNTGSMIALILLSYLYLIIFLSFLNLITRQGFWFIGLVLTIFSYYSLILLPIVSNNVQKFAKLR